MAEGTGTEQQLQASRASAARGLWNLIKRAGPATVKAAKRAAANYSKFRDWVNDLDWYNPIKLAWKASGSELQYQMWKFIHDQI